MLRIDTQNALIGINTTNARMSMIQPKAEFEIHQKHPKAEIHTEHVKVLINQRQCFNEAGLKDYFTLTRDIALEGRQAALEGIGRRVDEGNLMADNLSGVNVIAEIAYNNSFTRHEFNFDLIPKSRPVIDFIGGTVDIRVDEGKVEILAKPNKPKIEIERGKVEVFMRRHSSIKFSYVDERI